MEGLSESETATVEEHLLTCETCRDRLNSTDEFLESIRASLSHDQRFNGEVDRGRTNRTMFSRFVIEDRDHPWIDQLSAHEVRRECLRRSLFVSAEAFGPPGIACIRKYS